MRGGPRARMLRSLTVASNPGQWRIGCFVAFCPAAPFPTTSPARGPLRPGHRMPDRGRGSVDRLQHYAKPIPRAKIVARSIFARLRGQQVDKNHDERASREGIGRNARRQSPGHHRDSDLRVCYAGTRHHDRQCLSAPHPGRHVVVGCRWP